MLGKVVGVHREAIAFVAVLRKLPRRSAPSEPLQLERLRTPA
jgi:hypothetical protein